MKIEHLFLTKSHDVAELFRDTYKLSTFIRKLNRQAEIDVINYDRDKYVGDGFELFIELFLKLNPTDNRVGIYNYSPKQTNDNGVDGTGVNILGEPSAVQIKFRDNSDTLLTANEDHLSNFITDAMASHNIVFDNIRAKNYRHVIFTTAKGLHFYTDAEMFKGKVKCIGYNELRAMLDNNRVFWQTALTAINDNLK